MKQPKNQLVTMYCTYLKIHNKQNSYYEIWGFLMKKNLKKVKYCMKLAVLDVDPFKEEILLLISNRNHFALV